MDVHTPEQRSYNMSRIKGNNTKPEKVIRALLWHSGYHYRLHVKDLPGNPDLVFKGRKKVIFVNGCFWHKHNCKYFKWPASNVQFWHDKIQRNVERDQQAYEALGKIGWDYFVVWECETKEANQEQLLLRLTSFLQS